MKFEALAAKDGLRIRYLIDTHTHADHFTATQQLARQLDVPVVMHQASPAPFVDLRLRGGELLVVGRLRLQALHTPGHTRDSMCLRVEDRVFTGDTLLIGATGRTDLPSGDAAALHDSLFEALLRLDPELKVFPAHAYKGRSHSTIGQELAGNPRLQIARPRRVHRHAAQPQPDHAHPCHRGAAHQHEQRQDRGADARGSRGGGAVHVAGRTHGLP